MSVKFNIPNTPFVVTVEGTDNAFTAAAVTAVIDRIAETKWESFEKNYIRAVHGDDADLDELMNESQGEIVNLILKGVKL